MHRLIAVIALFGCMHLAQADAVDITVGANDFDVRCALVNPDNGQALTTIIPGELARATATVKVGEAVMARSVSIVATASASLHGFNMKLNIGESTLEIPPAAEREEIVDLYSTKNEPPPSEFGRRFIADFTLPNEWPRSRIKLRVVARIPDIGSKSCSKTLEVI